MSFPSLCPGRENSVKEASDLKPDHYRLLVARRARQLVNPKTPPARDETERRKQEKEISDYFEKISGTSDFLPVSFLAEGADKASAVCRVVTGTSLGSGFLIADGILITNNHVIESRQVASDSIAEFHFEDGRDAIRVRIRPDRVFITDETLDFTIVGCESTGIEDIVPIPLQRNPATVTRHERVSIIQHPRGRPKEVALHDNKVLRVLDRVVRYSTDTAPGSSGSAVFNNTWQLVALHHAGWKDQNKFVTNEGIRITAIVDELLSRFRRREDDHESARRVIDLITDVSPYLGFFDVAGFDLDRREVVVNDFRGDARFADLGVWNVEHFNDSVDDARIEAVADVVGRLALDVLGLTEVQAGAMDRLIDAMGHRGFAMDYSYGDVRGRQDLAVLYDAETTTATLRDDLLQKYDRRLSATTPSGRTAFPRKPLFVQCRVNEGTTDANFLMIVVHLKAFGDAQSRARRRLASEVLAEIIDDIRKSEGLPIVLGGDFNERLDNTVLDDLQHSPDLFAMTADDRSDDAISYIGASHRSLIDHIMVSRDVNLGRIAGDDAAIVRLDRSVQDFARDVSDHIPIVFRIVYRDMPIDARAVVVEPRLEAIPESATSVLVRLVGSEATSLEDAKEGGATTTKTSAKTKKKSKTRTTKSRS